MIGEEARMRTVGLAVAFVLASGTGALAGSPGIDNPAIDMAGYLKAATEAARHRETRRVSEDEFLRLSGEAGTIVLDARSRAKYDELHVKGAVNLSFPDIAIATLQRTIPDKSTRILIYCNNNFRNAPGPFPSKLPSASLNLSTYIALYNYGYRNVYELAPVVDLDASKLSFESSRGAGALRPRSAALEPEGETARQVAAKRE
jgi:phage shock protein E